jgi:hypothetical protein
MNYVEDIYIFPEFPIRWLVQFSEIESMNRHGYWMQSTGNTNQINGWLNVSGAQRRDLRWSSP